MSLPLIDLHRHLSGSISPITVYNICQRHGLGIGQTRITDTLTHSDRAFKSFMDRFEIFREIPWADFDVAQMARQVVCDLVDEGIKYAEIRFSTRKFSKLVQSDDPLVTSAQVVCQMLLNMAHEHDIDLGLVLSTTYESKEDHEALIHLADDEMVNDLAVGIDFVGHEDKLDAPLVKTVIDRWCKNGKEIIMHVGESQGCDNIKRAYYDFGVRRIAHGIRVVDDPVFMREAAKDCMFYLSPTSNIETGVVKIGDIHPGRAMIDAGCKITIGTDDPAMLGVTLRHEYTMAATTMKLTDDEIKAVMQNSIDASILEVSV